MNYQINGNCRLITTEPRGFKVEAHLYALDKAKDHTYDQVKS